MVVMLIVIMMWTLVVDDASGGSDDGNAKEEYFGYTDCDDYIMKTMMLIIITIERMEMTAFVFKAHYVASCVLS